MSSALLDLPKTMRRLLRYTPPVRNEDLLIAVFVKRSKRESYREILSNPRLRHKFTNQLAHFADFDPKYRLPIPSDRLFVENIALELQKRQSPSIVYAISEDPALDQREFPLLDALGQIVGRGMARDYGLRRRATREIAGLVWREFGETNFFRT